MKLKKKNTKLAVKEAAITEMVKFQDYAGEGRACKIFDVKDNAKGIKGRIPQIKIIHPAQIFEDPAGKKLEEITCIILHHSAANAYWKKSFNEGGGGHRPDCSSLDGLTPMATEENGTCAKNCSVCKKNQFGSAEKGIGKACKNMWRLHIIIPGQLLPKRLTLPPSSLGPLQDFLISLIDYKIPHEAVIIKLTLKEAFNKSKIKYSEIVIKPKNVITDEARLIELKKIKDEFSQAFGEVILSDEFLD